MGATADGAGMLRGGGLFSGFFGFTVLIRQERPAIGIGAAPEKFVGVLPAFLPAQRLAALRAWEGTGLERGRGGEDGIQKQRKSCILFAHEVFQRVFPTGYGFNALFPLGRSDRIVDTRDLPLAAMNPRPLRGSRILARVASVSMPSFSFRTALALASETKRWMLAIASISEPSENLEGGVVFFLRASTSAQSTASLLPTDGSDCSASFFWRPHRPLQQQI